MFDRATITLGIGQHSTFIFLFEHQICEEALNRLAPNVHEGRVWSLARTSLNVIVKGQGHHSPGTKENEKLLGYPH